MSTDNWKRGATTRCSQGSLKLTFVADTAVKERMGEISVRKLANGRYEMIAEESTKKTLGKRWHTSSAFLEFDAEQMKMLLDFVRQS